MRVLLVVVGWGGGEWAGVVGGGAVVGPAAGAGAAAGAGRCGSTTARRTCGW